MTDEKTYDLYLLATDKAVIVGWHSFDAAEDQAALEIAEPLIKQPPAELWRGTELVKRWDKY